MYDEPAPACPTQYRVDSKEGAMTRLVGWVAAITVLAAPVVVSAQETLVGGVERPRVEAGAGVGAIATTDGGWSMVDTRVGVRLSRNWSVEGLVQFSPPDQWGSEGYYRAQAVWRSGKSANQLLAGFGVAGYFERWKRPEFRTEWGGTEYFSPAASGFEIDAPTFPTATVGFERILASHLALRVELTVVVAVGDGDVEAGLMPAVGISIPFGHYTVRR
jgi:hypothetical protein